MTKNRSGADNYGRKSIGQTAQLCNAPRLPLLAPKNIIVNMFEESVADNFHQVKVLVEQNKLLAQARDLLLPRLMSRKVAV